MGIKLSILDQSPIFEGENAELSFARTIELARKAEELGYQRFWVSEHHDSNQLAGSSPEVLISHLLAKTEHIRIGSGGIMLQHYSPYKVAENFNVLASLAPGRIDLGVGRAPGGLPRSTRALQQGGTEATSLSDKIIELAKFIHNRLEEDHPLYGLRANPVPTTPAQIYVLGSTVGSAEIAAQGGFPYVFSQFINNNADVAQEAFSIYRARFDYSKGTLPQAIFALSAIVADTDEEAKELAGTHKLVKIYLESGKTLTVGTLEQGEEYGRQSQEKYTLEVVEPAVTKGSKETVRAALLELQQRYDIEEFIVTTAVKDFQKRLRSFELLKEAFEEAALKV
ncbi:MAG: alkane 1-monooxygenase [Paenibacillus sp.]|jgi:luciferase family oxidoreductase group 1|nr:alkane 1-monooxygenase [Paenibacillus sp.]